MGTKMVDTKVTKKAKKPMFKNVKKMPTRKAIMKVKQQVHPGIKISYKTLCMVQSMISDQDSQLWTEAAALAKRSGRKVITGNDMSTAIKLSFRGELSKHGASEAAKAWQKFSS